MFDKALVLPPLRRTAFRAVGVLAAAVGRLEGPPLVLMAEDEVDDDGIGGRASDVAPAPAGAGEGDGRRAACSATAEGSAGGVLLKLLRLKPPPPLAPTDAVAGFGLAGLLRTVAVVLETTAAAGGAFFPPEPSEGGAMLDLRAKE